MMCMAVHRQDAELMLHTLTASMVFHLPVSLQLAAGCCVASLLHQLHGAGVCCCVAVAADIYLLPPNEDPETCQSWLRMRNRDGRYRCGPRAAPAPPCACEWLCTLQNSTS